MQPAHSKYCSGEEKTELLEAEMLVCPLISQRCRAQAHPGLLNFELRETMTIWVTPPTLCVWSQTHILSRTVRGKSISTKRVKIESYFVATQGRLGHKPIPATSGMPVHVQNCRAEIRSGLTVGMLPDVIEVLERLEFFSSYICEQHASRGSRREVWLADRKDCQQIADRSRRALERRGKAKLH